MRKRIIVAYRASAPKIDFIVESEDGVSDELSVFGEECRRHLYRDECGNIFILTRHTELFVYSVKNQILGGYSWHRNTVLLLQKQGVIPEYQVDENGIYRFHINRQDLPLILKLDGHKRRPDYKGRWIRDKEVRLGHSIRPLLIEGKKGLKRSAA
ncbi:MAG: hypothetical protein ACYC9O_20760 [Candidatus Latescibacterota bacterium]